MKNAMKMLILVAGTFAAKSEAAFSDDFRIFGSSCHSTTPGLTAMISSGGIYNTSSTKAMTVACPVAITDRTYTSAGIDIWGTNRHDDDDLSCTINFSSTEGSGWLRKDAVIANSGPFVQHAKSGILFTTPETNNFWIYCRIPPTFNGSPSFLRKISYSLEYTSN